MKTLIALYGIIMKIVRKTLYFAARALQCREFQKCLNFGGDSRGTEEDQIPKFNEASPIESRFAIEEREPLTTPEALKSLYRGGISRWNNKQQLKDRKSVV